MSEIGLTAKRELRKNLRSKKGIAMFGLFFMGGFVISQGFIWLARKAAEKAFANGMDPAVRAAQETVARSETYAMGYGKEAAEYLKTCPLILHTLTIGTFWALPFLALLLSFDQLAAEIQHRTIRYTAGRAQRSSIVLGKALGGWIVLSLMVLVLHTAVWIAMIAQLDVEAKVVLSWGLRNYGYAVAFAGAYTGFISFVSSFFKSPNIALFLGGGVVMVRLVLWALVKLFAGIWPDAGIQNLLWAFPMRYTELFWLGNAGKIAGGIVALIAWGGLWLFAANEVVSRRDL